MDYWKEKTVDLVEATKRMLKDAGFYDCDQFFGRRIAEGVLTLADHFQRENYSVVVGRLVVALFSRIARGSPPTPEFLKEVWREIEVFAEGEGGYNEVEEKGRWIQKRYPMLHWAGDLHKHINSTTFPRPDVQKFAGAPLVRNEPMDPPPTGMIEDEPYEARGDRRVTRQSEAQIQHDIRLALSALPGLVLWQPKVVKLSEIKNLIKDGRIIQAIKLYRKATGKGLIESRDFVYKLRDGKTEFVDDTPESLLFDKPVDMSSFEKLATLGRRSTQTYDNYGSCFAFAPIRIPNMDPLRSVNTVCCDEEEMFDNKIENIEKEENKMCANSSKIVEVIRGLCKNLESFTSLDVSNKAKADGFVARHREIAEFVRTAFADGEMNIYGYVRDLINVTISGGLTAQTYLYHHTTVPADDYKNRTQVAIRPSQPTPVPVLLPYSSYAGPMGVTGPTIPDGCTGVLGPAMLSVTAPAAPRTTRMLNTSSMMRAQKGDGRLEVPHVWMTRLNWQIGNTVFAVRDGNSLILKISINPGERVVRQFKIDRWNRIRITTKALMEAGLHLGTGGQHIMSLRTGDIKID